MSMNGQPAAAAIVGTFPMPVGTRFEWHSHDDNQLAWSPEGVLVVLTEGGGSYVLPPSRALWIPAGTVHETRASGAAVLRSVYVEPRRCSIDWDVPTPVAVSPLLGELIHHLDDREIGAEERARAEAVLFDLLVPLRIATIDVRSPADPRARGVADALLADPADPRTLHEWGRTVGASSRTLARAFLARHRALVRALAHARPPAGVAAVPRRADAGERRSRHSSATGRRAPTSPRSAPTPASRRAATSRGRRRLHSQRAAPKPSREPTSRSRSRTGSVVANPKLARG